MYDIFISYRRDKGSELSSFFNSELTSMGFNCFLDVEGQGVGAGVFRDSIQEAIKNSSMMVVLLTDGYLERCHNADDICREEILTAQEIGIPILPISINNMDIYALYSDIPEELKFLSFLNTRMYKHELKLDTFQYIKELALANRKGRFNSISSNFKISESNKEDKTLSQYIRKVENEPITFKGKNLKYTGELKFDNPSGKGTLVDLSSGYIYEMEWSPYFKFQGEGIVIFDGEIIYEGGVSELLYHGQGKLTAKDNTYVGSFVDGKIRGKGTMVTKEGNTLIGEWLSGLLYKNGYIRYANGDEYQGTLTDNIPDGYGLMIKSNGFKYDGHFRNGHLVQGALYSKDSIFVGDFTKGIPDGRGSLYTPSFEKTFEGVFKNGKATGDAQFFITGNDLANFIIPQEVYDTIKQYYSNIDEMSLTVRGNIDGNKFLEYNDYTITDSNTLSNICVGHIESYDEGRHIFKVYKDYKLVYDNYVKF